MKQVVIGLMVAVLSLGMVVDADAKRLGGGTSSGLKRQAPPPQQHQTPAQQAPANPAANPAAANPAAAAAPGAAAAAGKRSWLGPIAGLAAGLGIAALLSHLGLGAEFASFFMILLMVVAGFFLVRFLLRRFGPQPAAPARGLQFAGAGAGGAAPGFGQREPTFDRLGGAMAGAGAGGFATPPVPVASAAGRVPAGFDSAGFERIAKLIFIRLQAANDAGNLDDLRRFSTPEMFAVFRLDIQDRRGAVQQTDVMQLDAQVLEVAEEGSEQVVSVRFHGLIGETAQAAPAPFDETWHLVKPLDGSREWAIAGIAQNAVA